MMNWFLNAYISGRYLTINDYNGSSWTETQKITSSPYQFGGNFIVFNSTEDMFCYNVRIHKSVGRIGVYTESGGAVPEST